MVAAILFALLVGLPALRLRADYLAIATIAFAEIIRFSAQNARELTGGSQRLFGLESEWAEVSETIEGWLVGLGWSDPDTLFPLPGESRPARRLSHDLHRLPLSEMGAPRAASPRLVVPPTARRRSSTRRRQRDAICAVEGRPRSGPLSDRCEAASAAPAPRQSQAPSGGACACQLAAADREHEQRDGRLLQSHRSYHVILLERSSVRFRAGEFHSQERSRRCRRAPR